MGEHFEPKGPLPFFAADFERDTRALDDDMRMKYLRLLNAIWEAGGYVADDDDTIARLAGVPKTKGWQKRVQTLRSYLRTLPDAAAKAEEKAKKSRFFAFSIAFLPENKSGFLSQAKVLLEVGKAFSRSRNAQKAGKQRAAGAQADAQADADPQGQRALSPHTLTKSIYSPPPVTASANGGAGGGEGDGLAEKCRRVQQAINSPMPMNGVAPAVQRWLAWGADLERDILPTITEVMAQRHGQPPGAINYFDKSIKRALDERTRAAPDGGRSEPTGERYGQEVEPRRWRNRVRAFAEGSDWPVDVFGPKPGDPHCRAPDDVLREFGFNRRRTASA